MTDQPTPPDSATTPYQWAAIAGFLAGEGSAGDTAAIRQWLQEHPNDAQVVASLESLLPTTAVASAPRSSGNGALAFERPVDTESALNRMHARMQAEGQRAAHHTRPSTLGSRSKTAFTPAPKPWTPMLWAAAAAVIAVVGVSQLRRGTAAIPSVAVTYDTPVGATDSVTLSDGSLVILAAGSRLTVSANYGQGQRDVELQGEGRFTVKHDATRPFAVRIGSALVRDLGTVFTVKSIGSAVVVAVTEGSVSLSDSAQSHRAQAVDLNAGDRGRLLADGSVVSERGTVTSDEASWVVGKLVYRDASFAEVQADLRRWFGVELVVSDSALRGNSITAYGTIGEPVKNLIAQLEGMMGGVATTRGDSVFIAPAGGKR
ncbi:MAG: FecR domain-containing protein [Phycisphaerae bacterium]|nr:FecR domain-containing protein [Gemmatimonadaceae bacterium]